MPHILSLSITQKGEIVNKKLRLPAYGLRDVGDDVPYNYRRKFFAYGLRDDEDLPHECCSHAQGPQIGRPPLRFDVSHGCSMIVGDDILVIPQLNKIRFLHFCKKLS